MIGRSPSFEAVVAEVYAPVVEREFGPGTYFWNLHWDAGSGTYLMALETRGWLTSGIRLDSPPIGSERGLIKWLESNLLLLRQTHHFALAYDRGGYC